MSKFLYLLTLAIMLALVLAFVWAAYEGVSYLHTYGLKGLVGNLWCGSMGCRQ